MQLGEKKLLPCSVSQGMFSNEYAVSLSIEGQHFSLFAEKDQVENRGQEHFLRVTVVGQDPTNPIVSLPYEIVGDGAQNVRVPQSLLKAI